MAAKDEILANFLRHDLFLSKYGLTKEDMPKKVREGLQSQTPIIKSISLMVDGLERTPPVTDNELRNSVLQYLNSAL
jgi:hypothetical protein